MPEGHLGSWLYFWAYDNFCGHMTNFISVFGFVGFYEFFEVILGKK